MIACVPPVYRHATLNPGETLFIPVLMLHEVQTAWGGGSLGVNTFFEQFDFPDSVIHSEHADLPLSVACQRCEVDAA
eukprot:SAG11_NODE_291_length_11180_cov_102.040155_5_plen_77_part_00